MVSYMRESTGRFSQFTRQTGTRDLKTVIRKDKVKLLFPSLFSIEVIFLLDTEVRFEGL